jgi:hypothetical protein
MTASSDPEDPGDLAPHGDGDDGAGEEEEPEDRPVADAGHPGLPPVLYLGVPLGTVEAVGAVDGVRIDRRSVDPDRLPLCGLRHRCQF